MWKSLRLDIAHRTAALERQSKTELLNIREQLRTEKKRVTKEITDVEEKVAIIEQDQTHFITDLKRERVKENSKFTVELQRTQIAIKESENKIRTVSEAVVASISDIRDELADDRISTKTELRHHADEIRRQGIAFDRLHGRQQRNEHSIGDVQSKYKQISRSICDISSNSMLNMRSSKTRMSDMRSETRTSIMENGLLDFRNSMTDFNNDRSSNNSNNSIDL